MKQKLIAVLLSCMVLTCGCGNGDTVQTDTKEKEGQAVTSSALDLSGDTDVPETEEETPGEMEEFASAEEMSKTAGTGFSFPDPDGYTETRYFTDDGEQVVVFSNDNGNTISFRKKAACGIAMDSSYTVVYNMKVGNKEAVFGSRGSEEKAGVAIWEDGSFQYKIETTQWQEISRDMMSGLVSMTN